MKHLLLVFLGGGLGCVFRFLIAKGTLNYLTTNFPLGTFISNILSCAILGAILVYFSSKNVISEDSLKLLFVTGFCGGLSTFSTFSFETLELIRNGLYTIAILNIVLSLLIGTTLIFVIISKT